MNDIDLNWKLSYDKESLEEVEVIIRNRLIVKLFPGSCPGYSNFVIKDGPLGNGVNIKLLPLATATVEATAITI